MYIRSLSRQLVHQLCQDVLIVQQLCQDYILPKCILFKIELVQRQDKDAPVFIRIIWIG